MDLAIVKRGSSETLEECLNTPTTKVALSTLSVGASLTRWEVRKPLKARWQPVPCLARKKGPLSSLLIWQGFGRFRLKFGEVMNIILLGILPYPR